MLKIFLFLLFSQSVFTQSIISGSGSLPKLELGLGLAWINVPYYPAASRSRDIVTPFPNFIYRGEVLRSDENGGPRSRLISTDNFELSSSIGLIFPTNSDKIPERKGMEDLDLLLEGGLSLIYHLIPDKSGSRFSLALSLATRSSLSTDIKSFDDRGLIFNPIIFSRTRLTSKIMMLNAVSGQWATKKHHDYFYGISPRDETPLRKAFNASSGNLSYSFTTAFAYNFLDNWTFYAGAIYDYYGQSPNKESTLHARNSTILTSIGITWWLAKFY